MPVVNLEDFSHLTHAVDTINMKAPVSKTWKTAILKKPDP